MKDAESQGGATEGASDTEFLLRLDNVDKRYSVGGGEKKTVLNGIDLHVRPNEFVTVVGPSGCGKSTLLRLILGSEQPSAGRIRVAGKAVDGPSRERGIVFQKYSLFPHLTVLDNIVFGLDLEEFSMPGRWLRWLRYRGQLRAYADRAHEFLRRMGLDGAAEKYPHELSGGMRQRVAIAQAAIMEPKILLMDEPFGALDDATRQSMQLYILELWERSRMTVFFVTHDLPEAIFLGTRIIVLSQFYDSAAGGGAKVVTDKDVPGDHPRPLEFRYSETFNSLLAQIRRDGLDPNVRQPIQSFDLSHPDAIRGGG